MYISIFDTCFSHSCPSGGMEGGQRVDNCTSCTQKLCTYCSTVLDLVMHLFLLKSNLVFVLAVAFYLWKADKSQMFYSLYYVMIKGVKGERSECKRFTRRLVFYRKRYLRFYILGPTWKMFDVHILSINVDIHYISVIIKYFFFPWKLHRLNVFEIEVCVCVRIQIAVKSNLFSFSSAPQHACHKEHLCNGRSVARLSCWLTVCAH